MRCGKCGAELPDSVKFCTECGNPIPKLETKEKVHEQRTSEPLSADKTVHTQSEAKPPKKNKGKGCARGCGVAIAVVIALLVVIMLIPDSWLDSGEEGSGNTETQTVESEELAEAKDSAALMIDTIDLMVDNYSSFIPEKKRKELKQAKKELKAICKEGDADSIEQKTDKVMSLYDSVHDTYVTDDIDSSAKAQISIYAEDTVKRFLNHPSSAKFGWNWDVKRVGKWYGYSGDVTASNSFGVEDKYLVYVEFKEDGKTLNPKYVNIGGKVFYGSNARLEGY